MEGQKGASQSDRAFEIFVKRAINSIHKESWGRNKESKDVKDACQQFLTLLEQHEAGEVPYEGSLALAVLHPLMLACASSNVKIVELALGALHKLVAHAWLQGESSAAEELLVDDSDIVTRVIKQVIKCGEISNPTLQLSVIRALLTFTTAEHFVAHGDSLMSAVRAVFNLALGSESEDIKRTACNALLQILNTVAKRVTTYFHSLSLAPSRRESEYDGAAWAGREQDHVVPRLSAGSVSGFSQQHGLALQGSSAALGPRPSAVSVTSQLTPKSRSLVNSTDGTQATAVDARTAQLAQLAEQHDIRGLEAALGAGALDMEQQLQAAPSPGPSPAATGTPDVAAVGLALSSPAGPHSFSAVARQQSTTGGPAGSKGTALDEPVVVLTVTERDVLLVLTAFCKLASREAGLTEVESYLHQGKLLALELLVKVLQNPQHRWENVRDAFTRHLRQPLCITLLRNWAASDPSAFQLAIKLLLAVMMQPKLRAGLKAELGAFYPLFVLLPLEHGCGNAASLGMGSGGGATPGSQGKTLLEQTDLHTLYIVLSNLKQLCGDVQLVVDLFVNYDCDAQAPPLFERTMRVLGVIAQRTDVSEKDRAATANQPAAKQQAEALARLAAVRDAAFKCISAALQSINQWATPLREQQHQHLMSPQLEANGHHHGHALSQESAGDDAAQGAGAGAGEAERLEAVWAHKSSLAKGITMFNTSPNKGVRYLVQQGLVEKTPQAVARFLREHAKEIDKVALGEYMGHHESFQISVMHAIIDEERYANVSIDTALRRLLCQFRLPGEAQKIDRIMEKFAERFFLDNPGQFRNADGPYLLSFAIIMLNTDAHNPLAERRLGKPDFVAMCHQTLSEEEGGGMAPVLDPSLLEGIFERIVAEEIVMTDPEARQALPKQQARAGARTRLASALGLYALAAPFKPLTRSWGKAAQGLPDAERKRGLLELAERAITRGVGSGWVTALHCELCRPMLTVGAAAVMDALQAGLQAASVPSAAEPLLAALVLIVQLAALLRLDEVCERAVGVLAAACKVHSPAPHGSAQEAKQLAALKTLLSLTSMPDVGSLGSAWAVLLRTVSALNSLTADLMQPEEHAPPVPSSAPMAVASPFNKMFQAWGISLGGTQAAAPPRPVAVLAPRIAGLVNGSTDAEGAADQLHQLRPGPGAALVSWALTDGKAVVEQLFSISSVLDGEAVVVYFRALCAVSSEELDLAHPRIAFLQRLVDCAYANTDRIRLIWGKLWAIIRAHLVAASCHTSQHVALFSVNALRGLATRLLSRAELAHFRAQEEALAPFVAVLRQSDDPEVRDATVTNLAQTVAAQSHGLGSGWRTLLDALAQASSDASPHVVTRAVQALGLPIRALYTAPPPVGHGYVMECVRAAVTAAQNRTATQQSGVAAVQLLQVCAAQLRLPWGSAPVMLVTAPSRRSFAAVDSAEPTTLTLASSPSASLPGVTSTDGPSPSPRPDSWALLLSSLADIIQQQDSRPLVANAAAQAVMAIMQEHSVAWSEPAWGTLLNRIIPALFHAPLYESHSAAAPSPTATLPVNGTRAAALHMPSPEFVARAAHFLPLMCDQVFKTNYPHQQELMGQLARATLQWLQQTHEPLIKCGLSGYEQLLSLAVAAQDLTSVQRLLALLQPVLQSQLITVMAATHAVQQRGAGAGGTWPTVLASSSHMLLLAHRVLARLHSEHWKQLPWQTQSQLLEPLASCARQCMLFNQTLEQDAARPINGRNGKHLSPGSARLSISAHTSVAQEASTHESANTAEPLPAATLLTPAATESQTAAATHDQDEVTADHILEAGTPVVAGIVHPAPEPVPDSALAHDPAHSLHPELAPSSASHQGMAGHPPTGSDANRQGMAVSNASTSSATHPPSHGSSVQVSLVRLEMEAARGVIEALESCIQGSSQGGDGTTQDVSPQGNGHHQDGPLHMLHGLCVDIIKQGAAALTQSLQGRLGSETATILADPACSGYGQVPATPGWLSDLRAPLLARAVLVVATTPGSHELQFVRGLFPHLLVVMCSHQPMVREAVAVYFSHAVRPLVMGKA